MINTSWFKHFPVYIDIKLKQFDNSLFQNINIYLKEKNFEISENENVKNNFYQTLKVVLKENKDPKAIVINFKESNMNLFVEVSEVMGDKIGSFSTFEEFKGAFSIYLNDLSNFIENQESSLYKKKLKKLKSLGSTKFINSSELELLELDYLDRFEVALYQIIQINNLSPFLDSFNKTEDIKVYLFEPDELRDDDELAFPLNFENGLRFIGFVGCSSYLALNLYAAFSNALKRIEQKNSKLTAYKEFDDLFSKLDIPLAVFDKDQNLILHNNLFIGLNLSAKKCFGFKVNEQVTIENDIYKVQKIVDSSKNLVHLNFIPVNEVLGSHAPSSEELGIVSSSIAHELNNPLAGVLAALNVLELDEYTDEIHEKFNQMKQTVNRCKKLVETFLGFSKVNNKNRGLTPYGKDSFMQAMELMRFRLIESNITIPFQYRQKEKLSYPVSSHVLSMIFYLFLGELLTCFSHQNLVELNNSKKINLDVEEDYNGITLKFDKGITLTDNLLKSKLAFHLVEGEKMVMNYEQGIIELVYKDEFGKL
jgi:signal transduction histidine kinase